MMREGLAKHSTHLVSGIKARNAINLPRRMIDSGIDFSGTPTTVVNGKISRYKTKR